ncbi:N-acetylmuramoyl-L-alanine amidase [Staphylococcus chromogenes]|uniref:N-acetylmuramoyl-L-alanine amidase n=1 Tax=Staphylococcus chromogenes TaxID=46126 RepID=UPI003D7952E7
MSKICRFFSVMVTLLLMLMIGSPWVHAQMKTPDTSSLNSSITQASSSQQPHPFPFPPVIYPNVNKYLIENHIPPAHTVKDRRMNTLPKLSYKEGTYKGIIIHEVGEDNRTLPQWVDRMYATYNKAFVHAFVDANEIHLTAPEQFYVWGAGKKANPYFYQIELVRTYTFKDFAQSVNNQAWLAAYMLKKNGLKPTLADDHHGQGTIISHNAVREYWGGTTHVDPISYYAQWGYDMHQFLDLVRYHYQNLPSDKS